MGFNEGFYIHRNTSINPIQYSMLFDGVNESIVCGINSAYNFERTDPFTISLWVRPTNLTGARSFISKKSNINIGWAVLTSGTSIIFQLINTITTNQIEISIASALTLNTWKHVVITYDGSSNADGVNVYINNILQSKTIVIDNLNASTLSSVNMILGRSATVGTAWFAGNMGIVRIWNSVLSLANITQDYNGGTMSNTTVNAVDNIFDWRAGTDAIYTNTSLWAFPDKSGTLEQTSPISGNMEYSDRTLTIP